MDILKLLGAVAHPTGLWANIIDWLEGGIANYAIVIILLTLIIKVVMLPFDFYNRYVSKKNSIVMAKLQPELNKINKSYANNPNLKNQKTAELYKKNNFNVYSTCFGMLIFLVLSMTIFFTLFSALNAMSAYKISEEFNTLNNTYNTVYESSYNNYNEVITNDSVVASQFNSAESYAISQAEKAVVTQYGEIKTGFLWIKNIWRADNWSKVTLDYKAFLKETKQTEDVVSEVEYNKVMTPIQNEYSGWNGYMLLAIINGGLSLFSMWISEYISKQRAKKKNLPYVGATNKSMMIIMPIIMALFTIFYNAAFGLYIVAGSLFSVVTTPLISVLVDLITEKNEKKNKPQKPSYSR